MFGKCAMRLLALLLVPLCTSAVSTSEDTTCSVSESSWLGCTFSWHAVSSGFGWFWDVGAFWNNMDGGPEFVQVAGPRVQEISVNFRDYIWIQYDPVVVHNQNHQPPQTF